MDYFPEQADFQDVSIDGSVVRAHACAAGAANSTAENEALGRCKGGFSCKIHVLCDGLGMPIKFILTGGQEAECRQAIPLLENVKALAVLADKGYDTNELRGWLKEQGITAVIPPKSNRKEAVECAFWHYKERHAIECLCSASSNSIVELLRVMRKKQSITWGCSHLLRCFYG